MYADILLGNLTRHARRATHTHALLYLQIQGIISASIQVRVDPSLIFLIYNIREREKYRQTFTDGCHISAFSFIVINFAPTLRSHPLLTNVPFPITCVCIYKCVRNIIY